jgi:predicted HicB family RNase H-like nuclease
MLKNEVMSDEPWVLIPPELHSLSAQTAAMEGWHLMNWLVDVIDTACKGDWLKPRFGPRRHDEPITGIPDELKRRAESAAEAKGMSVSDFVLDAIKKNCWDPDHLKTVQDALDPLGWCKSRRDTGIRIFGHPVIEDDSIETGEIELGDNVPPITPRDPWRK